MVRAPRRLPNLATLSSPTATTPSETRQMEFSVAARAPSSSIARRRETLCDATGSASLVSRWGERGSPVDQVGDHDQRDPCRIIGSASSDATLSVVGKLRPEEAVLGGQLRP